MIPAAGPGKRPACHAFDAPAGWQAIDFISDLHLRAGMPRSLEAWAAHLLHTPADAVFILGDLFEVWVGDDARELPFERRCVDILARASTRRTVAFMAGNRDFLLGHAMCEASGLIALPDPTLLTAWNQRLLLSHGDALCLADTEYQRFRTLVRSADWQADFLARPLVERHRLAAEIRQRSEARRRAHGHDSELWADVDGPAALAWLDAVQASTLVHGHTHRPGCHLLGPGSERQVLSDWDLDDPAAPRAEVLRLTPAGLQRVAPTGSAG